MTESSGGMYVGGLYVTHVRHITPYDSTTVILAIQAGNNGQVRGAENPFYMSRFLT